MKEALVELNKLRGVRGSLLVAPDGMVVTSALAEGLQEDVVGAMAASVATTALRCLERMGIGRLSQALLDATNGKLFLCDAGVGYLVTLADPDVNTGLIRVEMRAAAEKIRGKAP